MNQSLSAAETRFHAQLRGLSCVVCKRLGFELNRRVEIHHVSKGSSRQNNWLVVPLCRDHHDPYRTGTGLHGMSEQAFCSLFKVPHGTEYGLLAWVFEDLQEKLGLKRAA